MKRTLGRSGIEVSAIGMGCWAIGGPWNFLGSPAGWSAVDDAESIRAARLLKSANRNCKARCARDDLRAHSTWL